MSCVSEQVDATGLQCPMPLLKTKLALKALPDGAELTVYATDAGSARDIPRYLELTPHELLHHEEDRDGRFVFLIRTRAG